MDNDLNDTFFLRQANHFTTEKGYQTIQSTLYWVKNNLAPYINCVRSIIGQDQRCVIIADGLTSHFNELVLEAIEEIGNTIMIPLPAHSSHITQMLDVSIFNVFKRKYESIMIDRTFTSVFTKKLMRIRTAYICSVYDEIIKSGWEKAGFKLTLENGEITSYQFLDDFKEFLRSQALHQEHSENQ